MAWNWMVHITVQFMLTMLIHWAEVYILKRKTEALVVASQEIGLEVNVDRTTNMVMSQDPKSGWSHNIRIDNSSFARVEQFKYIGTTLTNQNSIQEEIKSSLKSGNACCHSVQNLLSSSLLSKNIKILIYRTIILSVVLNWCETWSPTMREERRSRVFENRMLWRIFWPKRDEVTGEWRELYD